MKQYPIHVTVFSDERIARLVRHLESKGYTHDTSVLQDSISLVHYIVGENFSVWFHRKEDLWGRKHFLIVVNGHTEKVGVYPCECT